jgi:hypothetical protein
MSCAPEHRQLVLRGVARLARAERVADEPLVDAIELAERDGVRRHEIGEPRDQLGRERVGPGHAFGVA